MENFVIVLADVLAEVNYAASKHPPIHSAHEGYAVLLEEVDEVWDEVKKRTIDPVKLRDELKQVAAMAIRMILDLKL